MSKPIIGKPLSLSLSQALSQPRIPLTVCDFPIVKLPHEQHIHANLHLSMNVGRFLQHLFNKKICHSVWSGVWNLPMDPC